MDHDLGMSHSFFSVALTGGIGSGKSSVANWLAQKGARIFDADAAAHKILQTPETMQWAQELWGDICLKSKESKNPESETHTERSQLNPERSELDRKKIAQIIFNNPGARRDWENFIHPQISLCLDRWLSHLEPDPLNPLVVFDIPLFFETNWGQGRCIDEVWVVYAPCNQRTERLIHQRGMNRNDIEARIAAQISLEEKARRADVVIDNSAEWAKTTEQLEELLARLQACAESHLQGLSDYRKKG